MSRTVAIVVAFGTASLSQSLKNQGMSRTPLTAEDERE